MKDNVVTQMLQELGRHVESKIPDDALYILMVVPSGEAKGRAHYVSSAVREDVVKLLREFANALEAGSVSDDRPNPSRN